MEKKGKEMTNTGISIDDIFDNYFGKELSPEEVEYYNKIVAEEADKRILEDEDFEENFDYGDDDWKDDAEDSYYESDDDWRNYSIEDSYADAFDGFEDAYWNID